MIRFKRVRSGHYKYKYYDIVRWETESVGLPYLWCLSIHGTGLDDFKTLAKVKQHIMAQENQWKSFEQKISQGDK